MLVTLVRHSTTQSFYISYPDEKRQLRFKVNFFYFNVIFYTDLKGGRYFLFWLSMATAAPLPLASSVEKTNGNKLSRLLIDGGTTVLRNIFDSYHPPTNLAANLHANYSILINLWCKKVLKKSQWEKLFPPGGGHPNSKNFDITLLFLLLTNICGLSPPPSGSWHKMPPASDTSREANIARIKFYRNELYGHVATTGIQTSVFDVKWQEISSVLVPLGLNQSEVDRLKREPCGQDYVRSVIEWIKNDQEIQFQLKGLLTKQQQVLQTQQEDHRTLQDTYQIIGKVQQTQIEASKLQQEDHRNLQDTHQTVSKVEQTQLAASKLQQEDHRTLQDTHQTVGRVEQTLQDTHQAVGNLQQMQKEAVKLPQQELRILQDTRQAVEAVQRSLQDTKRMVGDVWRTQQESQQQVNSSEAANAEERRDKGKEDEALRKLAKVDTERVIQYHSEKYQVGTRVSILENINSWLEDRTSEHRVMVISGDAGMGKSVISAVVCQRMQHTGRLSGSHFCQHNKERYRNPKVMLQSLACQLCEILPQYKKELVEAFSRNLGENVNSLEVGELFELLFLEPLRHVNDPGKSLLMVIDGLDESEYKGRNELLDVIANHFCILPIWFRFLVTTRPEMNIVDRLKKFNPVLLEQDDEENAADIIFFLKAELGNVFRLDWGGIEELAIKAAGHFLYAYLMVDFIKKNVSVLTTEELRWTLPSISDVYLSYFERLEKELEISEDQFLTFLSALVAAREPLPLDFVSKLLLSNTKPLAGLRNVRKTVESISAVLPVQDGCVHFFHKSVKDWLTDRTAYGRHDFSVDEKQGHRILSQFCNDELDYVRRKDVHHAEFSGITRYALHHGVDHLLESEELEESTKSFEEIVNNYVTNLDIVYAKLCVLNNTVNSEDIIRVQKREAFKSLSAESKKALSKLLFLLRKYHGRLATHPSIFFQVMVNEGGDAFGSEARELLQTKYHEIPYMEYVYKGAEEKKVETQASFRCTSQVVCFDISPQQEFMVCECVDGTIHLWSLQIGKLMWKHPVFVKKNYDHGAFRVVPNSSVLSCYRSVVFHPARPIVLPGILSHAYSVHGDLLHLFPHSNCRFLVCSVNGDSMITDCPNDAKCLVMWSLKNGDEIARSNRDQVVLSFAWSSDGELLAISHLSGLVCLVNALNGFETLAEVTVFPRWEMQLGMIKFAPNLNFLYCWCYSHDRLWNLFQSDALDGIRLNVNKLSCGTFSLDVVDDNHDYEPWDYESSSKAGFLMGDPISCVFWCIGQSVLSRVCILEEGAFAFVLNKQSVLRLFPGSNCIAMFSPDELKIARTMSCKTLRHVSFSVDGKTVYGVTERNEAVVSFDVSSGKLNAKIEIGTCRGHYFPMPPYVTANNFGNGICLVPVTNAVLLKQRLLETTVQLWNFELSQPLRSWPSLWDVMYLLPVTDRCVACVGRRFEVSVLDTLSGDIVKTIPICHRSHKKYELTYHFRYIRVIVCNRKFQLLSTARDSIQLSDDKHCLWNRPWKNSLLKSWKLPGMFSPTEEFVLISAETSQGRQEVQVLDASSGNTLHTLCTVDHVFNCAFVSDSECVLGCRNISESFSLQLFNFTTGDFLTVLDADSRPTCLASFPQKGLIAVGLSDSKRMCSVIEVKLPGDKVNLEASGK